MKRSALLFLLILSCSVLGGSPARRGTFLMYQPDGSSFLARLKGDEFGRVLTTEDGCAVTKGEDGFYHYSYFAPDGSRISSGFKVGEEAPAQVLAMSRAIPWNAIGKASSRTRSERIVLPSVRHETRSSSRVRKHCIIILAQFQDISFMNESSRRQDFIDLVTKEGSGSVMDYLCDQFPDSYEFNFTVGPIVTLSKDHSYYGRNQDNVSGMDSHPQELVREACILSDPYIDFSQFDDDGDGIVDNVFVIVAGKSEAEGADSDYMWPHQWYVPNLILDGKRVLTYALSTELSVQGRNSGGQLVWGLCNIGTFCHEYSHTLGLYDFYDTDGEGSGGDSDGLWGSTSLMDGGNYNNLGKTPPNYNAIDREILGIGHAEKMEAGTCTLEPVNENGRYLILENPKDSMEFFLFECRARKGWDAYIGGSGLAIYHIDISQNNAGWSDDAGRTVTALYRWENNEINCNPSFQCADMMETMANAIDVRQAFFPYRSITSFSVNSTPSFRFNDGTESPFAISDIAVSGDKVTFVVYDSSQIIPNVSDLRSEVYQDAAILTWNCDVQGYDGEASVRWGETSGSSRTVQVSPYAKGRYSLTLEGLSPTTAYSVEITFKRNGASGQTATLDFLTKASQEGKKPFIYLEYLSASREGGRFLPGTGLPLRVWNAIGEKVGWYYDGASVGTDGSGYFHPYKSGTLKAVVYHSNGTQDILAKDITFK